MCIYIYCICMRIFVTFDFAQIQIHEEQVNDDIMCVAVHLHGASDNFRFELSLLASCLQLCLINKYWMSQREETLKPHCENRLAYIFAPRHSAVISKWLYKEEKKSSSISRGFIDAVRGFIKFLWIYTTPRRIWERLTCY